MRLTRLRLRNYRVYDDLDLELPPGLTGIYGRNGSGKSTLVESILFALYGKARTRAADVRTTGVNAECMAEVEFEHEGHLYSVRRTVSGAGATVKASATADKMQVAEGVRDTGRYVRSILGMDDAAFRASVFAEQNQLTAFSGQAPAERRRLVLQLLGITPLDAARDRVRSEAREAKNEHERFRQLLPDLDALRAEVAEAAEAAGRSASAHEAAELRAAELAEKAADARRHHDQLGVLAAEHEALVAEGRVARGEHDRAVQRVTQLVAELAELDRAQKKLADLAPVAEGLVGAEERLRALEQVEQARAVLAGMEPPVEPDPPEEEACEAAALAAEGSRRRLSELDGRLASTRAELAHATAQAVRAADLSGEADCPLCGQSLGAAFEQVRAHRAADVARVEGQVATLEKEQAAASAHAARAGAEAQSAARRLKQLLAAWSAHERAVERRTAAEGAVRSALAVLDPPPGEGELVRLGHEVPRRRQAAAECQRIQGRLERHAGVDAELEIERDRVGESTDRLEMLREKVRALAFDPGAVKSAGALCQAAEQAADAARHDAQAAAVAAGRAGARAEEFAKRLAEAHLAHGRLVELADDARHLSRLAELLNDFRNQVVATVGPRLSVAASELFRDLTDGAYEGLRVNPEDYEIQILDGGREHGMDRFSGSETDLANLALRVAISEHVRFQSGGQVGLLVLDEVFGSLDDDRRERMLSVLERLKGRFRQILVITHSNEVKEQLSQALSVVTTASRSATVRPTV